MATQLPTTPPLQLDGITDPKVREVLIVLLKYLNELTREVERALNA